MATFKTLASQLSQAFETRTRDNGESFRCLKEGSPQWMTDVIMESHGDMMPDDWRYRFCEAAADHWAEFDESEGDEMHGAVDNTVDVYTAKLTDWLSSNINRVSYCDDAAENLGVDSERGLIGRLQIGQYAEIEETFALMRDALAERASDDDDDSSDDDANPFKVEGVDSDDGSRTTLAEFDNSGEARAFLNRYTARENAGNWNLIEVYDTRGEEAERLFFWERETAE